MQKKLDLRISNDLYDTIRIVREAAGADAVVDVIEAAMQYARDGEADTTRLPAISLVLYNLLQTGFDADKRAYEETCARNRANASRRFERERADADAAAVGAEGPAPAAEAHNNTLQDNTVQDMTLQDDTLQDNTVQDMTGRNITGRDLSEQNSVGRALRARGEPADAGATDTWRGRERFEPPAQAEVEELFRTYGEEKGLNLSPEGEAEAFCDFYASKGWRVGSSPMRDWRASVRRWARDAAKKEQERSGPVLPEYSTDMSLEALY